jgi:hypothetical protein
VKPTLRGVGLTDARQKIQLDRYSRLSEQGAAIAFLDTANTFQGWKTVFASNSGWVQYNGIAFGAQKPKTVLLRGTSSAGATLQIRLDNAAGPVIAEVTVPKGSAWQDIKAPVLVFKPGTHALFVAPKSKTGAAVEVDWVSFE